MMKHIKRTNTTFCKKTRNEKRKLLSLLEALSRAHTRLSFPS